MQRVYNSAADAFMGECAVRERDPAKLTRIMSEFAEATRIISQYDNLDPAVLRLDWFKKEGNKSRLIAHFRENKNTISRAVDAVSKAEARYNTNLGRQIIVTGIV